MCRYAVQDGLPSNLLNAILEGRDGRVWLGTSLGLARLEDGAITAVLRPTDGHPSAAVVRSLAEHAGGIVWVGTAAGVAQVSGGNLAPVPEAEALAGAPIHCVLPDVDGAVWLAGDSGLARLRNGHLQLVTRREGLPNEMLYWLLDALTRIANRRQLDARLDSE